MGSMTRSKIDVELQADIEQFLYLEAELLDEHRYRDWFELFADDVRYRVPTQANRLRRDRGRRRPPIRRTRSPCSTTTRPRSAGGCASSRPRRTGPRTRRAGPGTWSRTSGCAPGADDDEYEVRSNFICYRNRLADEVDIWAGERHDLLRRAASGWIVARRTVTLDQNVVLSKNLSVFF